MRTKLDEEAVVRKWARAEAANVVADEVQHFKALNKPGDDAFAGADEVSRPDLHPC